MFWLIWSLFKMSPHLLQLFRRMLQHCFAVKLQKMFVGLPKKKTLIFHHSRREKLKGGEFHFW